MNAGNRLRHLITMTAGASTFLIAAVLAPLTSSRPAQAACRECGALLWHHKGCARCQGHAVGPGDVTNCDTGGYWYWMRSPEQERRVVMSLYNRYCIRCHGVDGRGVWDIPDVPDFTDPRWQATRPDAYRTRVILEGRGAVMPAFRGTITLEEACAMSRYLYTFVPGTEVSRPDLRDDGAGSQPAPPPAVPTLAPAAPRAMEPPPVPTGNSRGPFSP